MIYLYYGVFRSRTIIVFCQFFPFVLSYSMYFGPPRLGTCILMCYAFLMYCPLYHYQMSILVFCYLFYLKIYFVRYRYSYIYFSLDTVCLEYHLSLFHFESVFVFAAEIYCLKAACLVGFFF